jgi:hypothetical protein
VRSPLPPAATWLLVAAAAFLAPCGGRARAGDDGRTARTKAYAPKAAFERLYPLPSGRSGPEAPACLAVTLGRVRLVFSDVDGNGRFDEEGVDGWTVEGQTHLVPLERPFVVGATRYEVSFGEENKKVTWTSEDLEAPAAIVRGLETLNARRLQNGLVPLWLDEEASRRCVLHARYMQINGEQAHEEDPRRPGYTEDGARAGMSSSLGGSEELADMADRICRQFFHRFSALDSQTGAFGLAAAHGYSLVDGASVTSARPWTDPVLVPAPGSRDQPRFFATSERPLAYPEGATPGFPITLQFHGGPDPVVEQAELTALGRKPAPVAVWTSWPGSPANATFPHNYAAICLIPQRPLEPGTTYRVDVRYQRGEETITASWTFETVRR